MSAKRETWKRFWPPVAAVLANVVLLTDFAGVASKVGAMLEVIDAFLPLIAAVGATFGGFWLCGTAWEWWSPRRVSVRLRSFAPRIENARATVRSPYSWLPTDGTKLTGREIMEAVFGPATAAEIDRITAPERQVTEADESSIQ